MNNARTPFLTALLLTGMVTSSQAQAEDFVSTVQSGLSGVNDIVQQGCGYVNGAGNILVVGGWASQNLQWVCSIAMMSDYVNGMMNAGTALKEAMKDDEKMMAMTDEEVMKAAEEACKMNGDGTVMDAVHM